MKQWSGLKKGLTGIVLGASALALAACGSSAKEDYLDARAEIEDADTVDMSTTISMDVEGEDMTPEDEQAAELINSFELGIDMQSDNEEEKHEMDVSAEAGLEGVTFDVNLPLFLDESGDGNDVYMKTEGFTNLMDTISMFSGMPMEIELPEDMQGKVIALNDDEDASSEGQDKLLEDIQGTSTSLIEDLSDDDFEEEDGTITLTLDGDELLSNALDVLEDHEDALIDEAEMGGFSVDTIRDAFDESASLGEVTITSELNDDDEITEETIEIPGTFEDDTGSEMEMTLTIASEYDSINEDVDFSFDISDENVVSEEEFQQALNDMLGMGEMEDESGFAEDETANETDGEDVDAGDYSDLIAYMEQETEGTAEVIMESDESQEHEMDGITVTLNGYLLTELHDFHTNFSIPFGDQTDGAVVIAEYTIENDTGDDAYYMPALDLSYVGASKVFSNNKDLIPEDVQIPQLLAPANDYLIEDGEEVTGYYTYPMGKDQYEEAMDEGEADIEVPEPHEEKGDVTSNFGKSGQFTIKLEEGGGDKGGDSDDDDGKEADVDFYEDKATAENMGDKKMIKHKEGIGESEQVGDAAEVTFEGYQFTEFEPNKDEAPRFEDFEGVVLATVKFNIDNNSDSDITKSSMTSKMTVDDGKQYVLGEGMLLNYTNDDLIEEGDSGDLLQVYVLDKENYDKILKDKAFEVEVGPIRDADAQDISKGKTASFELPE